MSTAFSELIFSLTLQTTLLILVTRWLCSRQVDCRVADRLWSTCHLLILLLCSAGFLLPHVRLLPASFWPGEIIPVSPELASTGDQILLWVWAAGAALLVIAVASALARATRLVAAAEPLPAGCEIDSPAMGDGVPVQIRITCLNVSPFCWQFHRPAIVLPAASLTFPADELNAILRHEVAHLQAGHPFSLFLQRMVEILFWFHPLVWLSSRHAAAARELVCDLNATSDREQAAFLLKGLYRLAATRMGRISDLNVGLAFVGSSNVLEQRVSQLLAIADRTSVPAMASGRSRWLLSVMALLATLIWLPFHPMATNRSLLSPWPSLSAVALTELGFSVRDYETDAYSVREREDSLELSRKQTGHP